MYPCVVLQVQYIGKRSKTKMDLSKKMYADEVEVWFSNRSPAILIKREKWQRKFSFHQMTEGQFLPKPHHPKGINTKYRHFLPSPLLSSKNPREGRNLGGYSWEFMLGVCRLVFLNPDPISDQKVSFPHPFSDLTSKIHTRFQTCPLVGNYVITGTLLQPRSISLAWRLDLEMRRQLILHETGITR